MRHSLNGRVRRIFTIVLTIIFLSQNIAWTAPSQAPLSISYQPSANLFIPEQYGRIDKSVNCKLSTVNSKSPTVILIKDAHCNYEAQTNISKILDILIRDYKIDLIGAEGASGYVNPSIVLESNPKEDVRKKVSDKFLRTGLLTASEALSINKGKEPGFTIWGVEDLKLYLRDFQAFRDSVGINNSAKHFIEILFNLIGQLKKKIYPEELLEFDDIIRKYRSNELPLTRFIKILYYKYGIPKQHQNLKIVLKSIRIEEKIDFKKVEYERAQLIRQLEKTLPKEDLQELVKQSLLFKLGKIPAVEYYTYLNGQTINLKNYTRLVKLQSRIDESRLFNELEDLTEKIYAKLCKDKISHNLHLLDKDINILNKILSLEATRENLTYFKENYARFTPENLLRFIRIQAPLNNINLPTEISSPSFIEDAEKAVIPAEEFYRLAIERDNALVENLVQTMDKNKKDKAVLICGGFHADGIKKLLQDKGISPITITPSITKIQEDSKELYLKRMMDERIDPEKLLKELGAENVSPTLATSRTGIKINLHEKIIASFKSYGYEIKQEFTQEEFRKLLPLLKELHNKALEDENESLKGFIENAVRQSGLEQKFQKLGGDSQEGKPKIFDPKFVRFTPQNLVLRLSNILGNSKELHRLRHVIPKLIKAKKEIRDAEEPSDITGGKAYPYNCQRCANRTAEILKRYGFHASIVDIKFAEKMSDKISHHAFVATRINDKDVIVDIAADEFELVEGKENEFLDLGVVILPLDYVKSNQERFWMYNPPVTQRSAESTAQEQQPDKQGGSESGNDTLHMKSMKLRKGSKYYADRLQIDGQDVDINSIKGQISGITSWQADPAMENEIDGMEITELESGGASIITVNGKRITIFKLIFSGKTFYITSDTITGFGPENFLNVINNALLALQGEGKDISGLPDGICIFNLSGSPHLFEDHTKNGFIGVNEALVNLYTNPSTTAEQKQLLSSLLQIGLEHELLHEMGITDESFIAQRDAKRIVEELYTKKGDIEKIKRLIALLEGDVEIEPDFKVELIIALIERHNRGRPIPNLRRNLNVSFDGDKTLKDYLLSFFENGFLLTIDPDDLRERYIAIEDIRMTLDLLLKTARELPPWWVKGKDIVPLIIKFTQGEKLGKMGETRTTEKYYADIPEDIAVDCLADNPARTFLHELAHYRWRQMGNPGVMELQRCLHGLLATQDVPWEELNHESIAEVAATGGITSFLKRYKLTWLMAQESSSQRLELYGAVRLILITHLFRNPEPHPGYTNLHEYTWPYATDYGSIEIMKGWVRHNGEGNWEEVIDERFLSTPKAPESNDAIKKGRVPHKTVNRQIRKAILEGKAYKIWNRAVRPQKGDKEISVNPEEENYIEQCKRFLSREYPGYLDTVDIVIIKDKNFLYFRNDNNHQSAHAGHRRRTCYLGEGLYNKIKNNPQTLAAAIAHEIFHIINPKGNETKAVAVEKGIDPERNLRKAIDELLSQGQSKEEKLRKFFSASLPNFFMQVHFGSDNPQPLIDKIIDEALKIDEQFAAYTGKIAPLIARGSDIKSRCKVERLCQELNDRYLVARGFYIYTDSFMLHSEHYLKIRFYQLYKRPYSNSLPPQLSVLQDRVYLMERLDSLERLYSQNFFNHSTYLHQIGKGMIPSDELQDIADETLRIRRGGEYFTDSHYNGLGNLQTALLRTDIGLEDISNIQREIENSFATGECHLLQGQNEIPYSLTLPYELRTPPVRRYDDLLFIARIAFGNVPFIEISRMLQYEKERNRVSASNNYEPLSAAYSFFLFARKLGFTQEKDQIRDWDVLRQVVERILALSTEELQRIAREIYEEELLAIRAQIPQAPTRTAPSLPPSSGLPSTVPGRAVTIDIRGNVLEELPAPERETGIPQHLVPFTERAERGETEREPSEASTSPETPGVRYEYIYRYTKANRGEEYYLNQIRQARVQLERTTDIEERIRIFLAVIWPQYLMALDDDSCGTLIEEQVRETAEILNAEFGRQIARIIPLARELNNPITAAGAKERIREIAAALRSNRFLIGHRFFLDTEVLERTNLQTHQTVWTLSSISYRIDSTNTYQVKFRGRNSTWIEIHFLGERVDRINQQREALGYTFLGDTFGVVVKKVVRDVVNMDIIPILNGVPFADAQVHPINETARRAVLRDGLPTHPAQTQLADIYEMFYRSTEIHELDHKIVECTERLAHLRNNPFEQRIRMEASAYLASIIDGPVPYSDLITILRLILGFRLALFDPYKPAGVLIFTEFARELGILDTVVDGIRIDEQNIRNGRLDTLNIILERLIKLNANRLRILAKKIRENILNIQTQPTQAQPPVPASVVGPQETATTTEARQQQEEPTIVPIVGDISTSSRFNFARIRIALFVIILALLAIFIHSDSIVTNYSHLVNSVPSIAGLVPSRVQEKQQEQASPRRAIEQSPELEYIVSYREYHVKPGESWRLLAKRFLGNEASWPILEYINGRPPTLLRNSTIKIPIYTLPDGKKFPIYVTIPHVVKPGESLSKIAQKYYGASNAWRRIHRDNPGIKDPNRIEKGQIIKIRFYVRKTGHTLEAPDEESKLGLTKDTNKIFKALFGEEFVKSYKYKLFIGPKAEELIFRISFLIAGLFLGVSPLWTIPGILFSGFLFYIRHSTSDRKTALFITIVNSLTAIILLTLHIALPVNTILVAILAIILPISVHFIVNMRSVFLTELRVINEGKYDIKNPVHRLIGYWMLISQFRKKSTNPPKYGEFSERHEKAIREGDKLDIAPDLLTSKKHRAELVYLAFEAFRLEQFIDKVKKQADGLKRPMVIIENLSYGRIALSPIRKRLESKDIKIWSTKVGSSEAHDNPDILNPDLLTDEQIEYLIREKPIVIVVDGSNSLDPLVRKTFGWKDPKWPDGLVLGYSNYFAWLSYVLFNMETPEEDLIERFNLPYPLRMRAGGNRGIFYDDYDRLRERIKRIAKKVGKEGIDPGYRVHYWTPSNLDLKRTVNESPDPKDPDIESKRVLKDVDRRYDLRRKESAEEINGPSLILVQSCIEDELVPSEIRRLASHSPIKHASGNFDDTNLIHPFSWVLTPHGPRITSINRHFVEQIYPAVESIMGDRNISSVDTDYPFKMMLFDLDLTLTNVMVPLQDDMLKQLTKILFEGVQIGIITMQGIEELRINVIQPLISHIERNGINKNILCNLHLFPSGGAEGFGFNSNGELANPYYSIGFESDEQRRNVNDVIDTLIADTGITKVDRNQIIMLHDVPEDIYEKLASSLIQELNRLGIYVLVEEYGAYTITVKLPFVTKELARNYMLARFSSVRPEEIFVAGDNLYPDGPDFGMRVQGAYNFWVGDETDTLILLKAIAIDRTRPPLKTEIFPFRRTRPLEEYFPATAAALKAPGSVGLDEDTGAKEYIESIVNNPDNIAETIQKENATIHTLNLGDKLGIPRFSGATKPQDLVYAFGRKESDGKLHIYVTTAFWEILQENQLMLSFLTDHEYRENILGMSHAEASKKAWEFVDSDGMNPFYKFYLEQLADNGEEDELKRLFLSEEHRDDYGPRFKQYARKLLLGKRCISEIGIINELLKNDEGKTPGITNLYASHNIGAKVVIDTFSNLGEEINTFFNSKRENGLNISREEISIQGRLNIMSNIRKALQGEDVRISEDDWEKYTRFNDAKAGEIDFSGTDVVILHDHEFLGMVPNLKKMGKKVIWHCHLDLDNFNPDVWDRLRGYVNKCDLVILQPRDKYENIYKTLGITTPAVFAPPATIDPTSNKHRQLDKAEEEQIKSSLDMENLETTPYFLYTGRLDPQKGIMDMIRAFKKMYENLPEGQRAKLIIVSTPEDEKTSYYREIYGYIQGLKDSRTRGFEDIHILFLRPDDAGTDITINYLQRNALSGLQLSSREGFGLPMAEMMYKGRPVIGTDVGGIKTQIRHALTGYLVKPDSQLVENAAGYMTKLVLDRKEAERLGMKAKELASGNYLASNLVLNYLTAVYSVLKNVAKPMEAMSIPKFLAHTKSINIFDAVNTLEQEFYKLLEELEGPGINDEQREQTLRAIGNIMEYFEAIEHTIYDMFTSGGRASFLVLERLKNIFWKLYRENNWSTPVDVLCINLPVGAINTRAGMEMADDLKERFFEVVKKYMKEKKKEGILRYEKVSSGYYGIGKTQMYIIGLGAEDIPEIKRLYEEALMAIGIYKTEDFPIYIGHKRASLKGYKRQLEKSKSGERDKYLENLVIDTMQEALGMAEFIEKKWRISNKYSLSSGDWIMRVPGIRKIVRRLGRKKFIPENEYETNRLPRIRHMLGFLSVKRKSILSNTPRKAHAIFYVNNLRGILLKSLKDVRYRGTYKREYIDGVVEQMKKDNSFFTFLDWTMEKAVMTRAGDEMWFYVKTDKGIESFFGELNKFNAFNDAYEADSKDSFYHQVIKWLKLNMPEIYKFYKKLYEDPSSITLDDIANFDQLTKFLEQIGHIYNAGEVLEILRNPQDERRAGLIEKIKSINVIKYADIKVPDALPYNSKKGYTAYTEAARVKGKWFKVKLVKSKPLVIIKSRERKKICELPFHSSDKLKIDGKIHRLKLYVMKGKKGEIIRRFVVHNYRIYTADGKGQDDEEDITDSVLSHRDEYEFEPDVTTLGVTLTFDRANLLNLRGDFDESNAHQKKYMHALVSDVSENTANQIISIIKTNYNPGFSISQSDLAETIIQSSKGTYNINFMNLWDLLKQKGVPEHKFFEIAVSLSNPINDLLGSDARSKGGLVISAVLREILKSLPAAEREIIVNEQKTPEEQLLETLKHIAKKKGIDPNAIQSIFDLFKGGIDILTMDPALDPRQIDGSYFTLIQQLCELTGISESAIMNAFKDNFGINFRITQGKIIPDSILWKETQRLMEYNRKDTGDYPLAGVNTELWDSDFHSGRVVDKAENKRNLYLSALDAVTKDVKAINSALRETPARNTVESRDPVGVIYHINDYIKYDKKTGSFSFRPGSESILRQMGEGINIVFTTEDVPEDELMFYKQALKATERFDKSIFITNTLEDAHNLLINKGIDKAEGRIVYVTKTEQNAIKARKLGIKSIIAEEVEGVFAFHATLIFAVLYARAKPNEVKTLIWHFLKLMGYKDDKIAEVISDLKKHGFFTVRLIRIADTLREFQNRKIFIDAAA